MKNFERNGPGQILRSSILLFLAAMAPCCDALSGESPKPKKPAPEHYHVILRTTLGPIRIELEHDTAPEHTKAFLSWCRAGVYDGVLFNRIVRGTRVETGNHKTRTHPLTTKQKDLLRAPPPEKGTPRTFGGLSLIPLPDSEEPAVTAFSISTEHDIRYVKGVTFFGRVVHGRETLLRISNVRVNKIGFPLRSLIILKATLVDPQFKSEFDPAYNQLLEERYVSMADPIHLVVPEEKKSPASSTELEPIPPQRIIFILALLLLLFGWGTVFLGSRKDPRHVIGFGALAMLAGGFSIFSAFFETALSSPHTATLLFFGTLVGFWLLSFVDRRPITEGPPIAHASQEPALPNNPTTNESGTA